MLHNARRKCRIGNNWGENLHILAVQTIKIQSYQIVYKNNFRKHNDIFKFEKLNVLINNSVRIKKLNSHSIDHFCVCATFLFIYLTLIFCYYIDASNLHSICNKWGVTFVNPMHLLFSSDIFVGLSVYLYTTSLVKFI